MRWTAARKAEMLDLLSSGGITEGELEEYFNISADELASWRHLYTRAGKQALRATKLQMYRRSPGRAVKLALNPTRRAP